MAQCEKCRREINPSAKFCKYCGASATPSERSDSGQAQKPAAVRLPLQDSAQVAGFQYCEHCRARISVGAQFCKRCGKPAPGAAVAVVEEAAVKPRRLPPREIRRPIREPGARTISALPAGSKVAALGGLVALAGCLLPLASGVGENTSIVPALTKETAYALLAPLSALALAIMAWSAASAPPESRVMLGGTVIALGSPWAVLWILAILAATKAFSALGPFGGGGGIGVGVFALAAGFVAAVVGGFIVLRESVTG